MRPELKRLWHFARPYRRRWAWGFTLLLLTNAATMTIPQLFRFAIDAIRTGAAVAELRGLAAILVLIAVCGAAFRVRSRVHIFFAARDVEMDVRCAFYQHLTRLEPRFFRGRPTGDLMSRASNDVTQVRLLLGPAMLNLVNTAIAYGAAIPLMLGISLKLTLLTLAVYPPALLLMRHLARRLYVRNKAQQEAAGAIAGLVQEDLAGAHVVRAFGIERERGRRFARLNEDYYRAGIALAWVRSGMFRLMMSLAAVSILMAVFFGARDVLHGRLTVGDIVAVVEYMALLAWPTFALGWVLAMWQRGAAAMSRIDEILAQEPEVLDGSQTPETLQPTLDVSHLSVAYEDGRRGLVDVSVSVPAGSTLGVVGPIGSGKSTLVRALMRLVRVPAGQLRVGGYDVTDLDLRTLRGMFGYVPQNPGLFSRSLADNVAFGAPDTDRDMIREALSLAAFSADLEMLPEGLDTPVGERGITLSGGQKQRAALARALLLAPPILVLDDCLSAVDSETEAEILGQLQRSRGQRTTVIVAHRISAVQAAQAIIVLSQGRVVEQGTHAELLAAGGLYARMARQQELERCAGAQPDRTSVA